MVFKGPPNPKTSALCSSLLPRCAKTHLLNDEKAKREGLAQNKSPHCLQGVRGCRLLGAYVRIRGSVVAELLERLHLPLQPDVELVAEKAPVHLEASGQGGQLLHHDLQATNELELLGHDVQAGVLARLADADVGIDVVIVAVIHRLLDVAHRLSKPLKNWDIQSF